VVKVYSGCGTAKEAEPLADNKCNHASACVKDYLRSEVL